MTVRTAASAFISAAQLAERWHTTTGKLGNDRWAKVGPPYHKMNGRVLYALADVEAYERAARVETYGNPSALMAAV